jgi:ATP/maltotriose-dependent transcriptional regulator MalT
MASRVSSTRIIGRTAELAELEAALSDAAAGHPSLAFVAGESGVGKTRLIAELERRAAERPGARVVGGDCVELVEGELPYAPLVAALRPLVRRGDAVLDAVDPSVRAELAALAPSLAAPDSLSGAARAPRDDPDARGRLFEALLALLDALGQNGPVLLTIEDIHWADGSTRAFLSYLSASLCRERVMVVCTYRPDDLHRRHPLRPLLAELERDKRARRIELAPLTRDELADQLEGILGAPVESGLVGRLWTRTEGNPLFTEELLAAGLDGRSSLPPTLRDALMVRIERLDGDAQELLRVVAAAQRADHDLLVDAAGLDPRTLRDALREVVAANLLVVDDEGRYTFRHALLREVVTDDLLPGEAAELHRAMAKALEPRMRNGAGSAQVASAIAHHLFAAGDREAALAACVRAAHAALEVLAFHEAAHLIDRALELWDRVADPEQLAGLDQVELLSLAAHARDLDGDVARQEQLLRRALELVDEDCDEERVGRLLERLHRAQMLLNRQDEAVATLERGLALLPPDPPSPARTGLLSAKAKTAMLRSRFAEAIDTAREALTAAQATGQRDVEGRARNVLGTALMGVGELDEGAAELNRAWAIAEEIGDVRDMGAAATNLSDQLHLHGNTREALEVIRKGLDQVRALPASAEWLSMAVSEYLIDEGSWDEAASLIPQRLRRNVGTTVLCRHLRIGELALARDDRELARSELDAAARLVVDSIEPQFLGTTGALVGELRRRDGDLPGARAVVEDALESIEFCSEDAARIARAATVGVKIEADIAQHARDRGDHEAERDAIARAELLVGRVEAAAAGPEAPVEAAYALTAQAEFGRATGEDEPQRWAASAAAWDALERPYFSAQVRWREAEALFASGDRDAATTTACAARDAAAALGSAWLQAEVESFAARARLRVAALDGEDDPAAVAAAGDADQDEDPFGLTPRERQVLTLVARGATNREIGETLYMAEKTASVHVSRILAKLDVRSRTEAAGVAHRMGLDQAPV